MLVIWSFSMTYVILTKGLQTSDIKTPTHSLRHTVQRRRRLTWTAHSLMSDPQNYSGQTCMRVHVTWTLIWHTIRPTNKVGHVSTFESVTGHTMIPLVLVLDTSLWRRTWLFVTIHAWELVTNGTRHGDIKVCRNTKNKIIKFQEIHWLDMNKNVTANVGWWHSFLHENKGWWPSLEKSKLKNIIHKTTPRR